MQIIEANFMTASSPIVPTINRACVIGFLADVVNFIVFDNVIVAAQIHGLMWRVVNQIMHSAAANAIETNAGLIGAIPTAVFVDMTVFDKMVGGRECGAVAAA